MPAAPPPPPAPRRNAASIALLALAAALGCFDSSGIDAPAGMALSAISIYSDGTVTEVGDTTVITAEGYSDNTAGVGASYPSLPDARWSISPAGIARLEPLPVSEKTQARLLGTSPGTARVTVTTSGVSGSRTIQVLPRLAAIEVTVSADTITVGDTVRLRVHLIDQAGAVVPGVPFTAALDDLIVEGPEPDGLRLLPMAPGAASVLVHSLRFDVRKEIVVLARRP